MSFDPVHEENGKWYFWDETEADRLGPYDSEEEARKRLSDYGRWLDEGRDYVSD
jgi:hypothetical protein